MSKKNRNTTKLGKGRRVPEKQKSGIETFLEYTRIFGLIIKPKKNNSTIKLVLYQIIPMLVSIFVFLLGYTMFQAILSEENGSIILQGIGIVVILIAIISIIRSIIAMYAIAFRDYKGL